MENKKAFKDLKALPILVWENNERAFEFLNDSQRKYLLIYGSSSNGVVGIFVY
jgi:hypothetical protein